MAKDSTSINRRSESTRRLVVAAMLSAITALLTFTPIGMIQLPPPLPAVTMVHIPVMLAVLSEGFGVGMLVSLVFGVCSFIRAWESGMVGLTIFFRDPRVSILPRLFIPIVAFGIYLLWRKGTGKWLAKHPGWDKIGVGIAAACGTLTNTAGCLGMILLAHGQELQDLVTNMVTTGDVAGDYTNQAAGWLVAVVGLPNGIAEIIVAVVMVPILKTAVDAVNRRSSRSRITKEHKR